MEMIDKVVYVRKYRVRMVMYWDYFKYVVEHKKNVGIECLKIQRINRILC